MAADKKTRNEAYDRTRHAFDEMPTDEQVTFIVEATVSTIARGIQELSDRLAHDLDYAFGHRPGAEPEAPEEAAEPEEEPKKAAPRAKRKKTTRSKKKEE
ncbi:MAG: hypothetical protein AAGI71_13945 [Bacteroidota bacterium]